jgi:regulator of cell morphogenesis and NO signaling
MTPDRTYADLHGSLSESAAKAAAMDTGPLIDTIIARYHRVHSEELPELAALADRVETVHRDHPAVPSGLAAALKRILGELTIHMQKEEIILFPQMSNGARMPLQHPIAAMMAEHEEHGAHLEELRNLTQDFRVPDDGCGTWRALYSGIGKFADDLMAHIEIENNILFPRFLPGQG